MRAFLGFAMFAFFAVSAFAQSPATQPASSDSVQATVYFYRSHRFAGAAAKEKVFVDDARVGELHNGDCLKILVSPGSHEIRSTDKSTGVELDAKAGQVYYVRVDIQSGAWHLYGRVTLVDPQEGKYEMEQATHH